jgi:hypothetical protein
MLRQVIDLMNKGQSGWVWYKKGSMEVGYNVFNVVYLV